MPTNLTPELKEVLSHYDLGVLVGLERDQRGTVDTSFFIDTLKDGERRRFFLRRYKHGVRREEILFAHALISHIARHGSCPVARVHPTRQGTTFLRRAEHEGHTAGAFYAIFDLLAGEDRYTWVGPRCTLAGCARPGRRWRNSIARSARSPRPGGGSSRRSSSCSTDRGAVGRLPAKSKGMPSMRWWFRR